MKINPEQNFLKAQMERFTQMLVRRRLQDEAFLSGSQTSADQTGMSSVDEEFRSEAIDNSNAIYAKLEGAGFCPEEIDIYLLRLVLDEVPSFDRTCAIATNGGYSERTKREFLEDLLSIEHGLSISGFFHESSRLFSTGLLAYSAADASQVPRKRRVSVNRLLADLLLQRKSAQSYVSIYPSGFVAATPYLNKRRLEQIEKSVRDSGSSSVYLIHGPSGSGKRRLASHLAAHRGHSLLKIDMSRLQLQENAPEDLRHIMRAAAWFEMTVLIHDLEICAQEKTCPIRAVLDDELSSKEATTFLTSTSPIEISSAIHNVTSIELTLPDTAIREAIWKEISADFELAEDVSLPELARLFQITEGPIREALREARGNANDLHQISRGELLKACRGKSVSRLSELAFLVEPKFSWDDLVLAPAAMHLVREIEADIRADARIFEEWYMDRVATAAKGHNILFTGIPGTGKTMAASIIASELGLELYKIDLSRVSSKYVGDVEKNLAALFDEAEKANAALFFDEADSLFGKRGDNQNAQGHYVNQQVGYLLQRLESFKGVAFMATNLEKNMDKAFERRFNYVVPFTFPETGERIRIWQRAFSAETPVSDEIDYTLLGTEFEATGANIKSIALKASRRAAADEARSPMEITRLDIVYATVREFDKIVKGWDLDYKGPFRSDIDRVRALLKGE